MSQACVDSLYDDIDAELDGIEESAHQAQINITNYLAETPPNVAAAEAEAEYIEQLGHEADCLGYRSDGISEGYSCCS